MDGIVLYTDGSFRQNKAGWGIHGYTYTNEPMKSKAATKQQPTAQGYKDVPATETVTVLDYIDAYGATTVNPTNNTGELDGAINAFTYAMQTPAKHMTMLMDSEYVRKGLTQYVVKWAKNNWIKADGQPVANQDYWKKLVELKASWTDVGRRLDFQWVKGHSGDMGNDKADANALLATGSAPVPKDVKIVTEGAAINKLKKQPVNPLIMESRLLFGFNNDMPADGYYYMYNLGRMHSYGGKPRDTPKDKLAKADLLIGRPISEATYGVYKALTTDEYLEGLIKLHAQTFDSGNPELGILHLANLYNAQIRQKVEQSGIDMMVKHEDILVLATADDRLLSRTLNPPRRANDAVNKFQILHRQLDEYMAGTLGEGVVVLDVSSSFFESIEGKNKTTHQLLKTITSNTESIEATVDFKGRKVKIKMVLNIDIPSRNQLARIGAGPAKVELLVIAMGPLAYSYAAVFTTEDGSAIYQSPYAQFILPK